MPFRFSSALTFSLPGLLALAFALPTAAAAAPPIQEVLGRGVHGDAGGVAAGTALFQVRVDLDAFPDARCNDGSGALFYVRAASRPADRDKWILYLQGGGSCSDYHACSDRWLSRDSHYGSNKMSTATFPPPAGIRAGGILAPERANAFAGWNAVFVYYCSSDSWSGQADETTLSDPDGVERAYAIRFQGADIVDAVIAQLGRQAGTVRYDKNPSPSVTRWVTVPDLRQATHVLLTGSSAGSNGVKHNADLVGETLRSTNLRCAAGGDCPLQYRAVMDAANGPAGETLDWSRCTDPDAICAGQTYESFQRLLYQYVWNGRHRARADASCISWHSDPVHDPAREVWRCSDAQHVARNHVSTPYFARMDLQDDNALPWSFGDDGEFATAVRDGLEDLQALDALAEEGGALQAPGIFGPKCGQHVGLDNAEPYGRVRVWDAARTTSYTYQEVLLQWLSGSGPGQWIEQNADGGVWPRCATGAVPCCP